MEGIEPFIKTMQIAPAKAPEVFFAWKAVCYYQVRFSEILEELKTMLQWVGNDELCYPFDHVNLMSKEKRRIKSHRGSLREKMREDYISADNLISEYERSYNLIVGESQPKKFMRFLQNAENSYLSLASHVSIATHSVNLWKSYMDQYGAEFRQARFIELFDGLTSLYGEVGFE